MALQIFGTRKCPATRKAERFFKERDIAYHFVDLAGKGISPGELDSVAKAAGVDSLVDPDSKRYKDRGLAYMDYDPKEEILAWPLLLRTPVVRDGPAVSLGDDPAAWAAFAGTIKG
jgi:arsenate reductase-like glutaredoxin family protein